MSNKPKYSLYIAISVARRLLDFYRRLCENFVLLYFFKKIFIDYKALRFERAFETFQSARNTGEEKCSLDVRNRETKSAIRN